MPASPGPPTGMASEGKTSEKQEVIPFLYRRGFRFLKDPLFMASTLFLKSPERIMGAFKQTTLKSHRISSCKFSCDRG